MIYFLQEDHTYSNKTMPPNSASSYEVMGASYINPQKVMFNPQYQRKRKRMVNDTFNYYYFSLQKKLCLVEQVKQNRIMQEEWQLEIILLP